MLGSWGDSRSARTIVLTDTSHAGRTAAAAGVPTPTMAVRKAERSNSKRIVLRM